MEEQLSLFPAQPDPRPPISITWNGWHGCDPVSPGCSRCYMMRRDREYGKDPRIVHKTSSFKLPIQKYRAGEHKGLYKIPSGSTIFTCFTSDFFHATADEWRDEAWAMIRERPDCNFFMVTKRPERIADHLPSDWGAAGYDNVQISCTCENQYWTDHRLPVFLPLPLPHKSITHEPMLERINIRPYLREYGSQIESVSCGGESGPEARICDYGWILDTHMQCVEYSVPFYFHQTGARLRRGNKVYDIPRELQHEQAHKAHLDFDGTRLPAWDEPDTGE